MECHFAATQEEIRKNVKRVLTVLFSSWNILKKQCLFWDRTVVGKVMKTASILDNVIVEFHRKGYESCLFFEVEKAAQQGDYLDEIWNNKNFIWGSRAYGSSEMSYNSQALRVSDLENRITDKLEHY